MANMAPTIALVGNPNVGKSTIFNALTGSRQHVGNWPGKTVAKKEGRLRVGAEEVVVVDLPGAYSLTAYSLEEMIARDFIINERPTVVVVVVDASNLERNLYLVTQIMELGTPFMVALNMSDVAAGRGLKIDINQLSQGLGSAPVVEMVGNRSRGLEQFKEAIVRASQRPPQTRPLIQLTGILGEEAAALEAQIAAHAPLRARYNIHWLATKLLENDPSLLDSLRAQGAERVVEAAIAAQERIESATGEEAETLIVDQRYAWIGELVERVLQRPAQTVITTSDKIDAMVTHRIWGLPVFLLMMWLVFQFTAEVSAPMLDWVDGFINETVYSWSERLMAGLGLGGTWLAALVSDGIIPGVGGVLAFTPVLLFLYLTLAVLEDSGYMARAAFVMDRVMGWMGLHGKSFLPLIVGFGCTVPAVYATRALENERDRKLTGFLTTFMSCGARLPVYVVFGAAFFGATSGNLIFAMYLVGIGVALATGLALKHTVYKGQPPAPFVMELPPYRVPHPRDVWRQMWNRTADFVVKAGTVILALSIVMWLLMAVPGRVSAGAFNDVAPQDSLLGVVSGTVAPVFRPAGFGSWQASGALVAGFLAKEAVVGALNQMYATQTEVVAVDASPTSWRQDVRAAWVGLGQAVGLTLQEVINIAPRTLNLLPGVTVGEVRFLSQADETAATTRLEAALVQSFTASAGSAAAGRAAALAFNVFVLLYTPCMATAAAMRQEFGRRWMWLQIGYTLTLAWVAAVLVFQVGKLLM